jgi:hypothetical protein
MKWEDEYLIFALVSITIMISIAIFMQGCTTTNHEPKCVCKCGEVDATFECSGYRYTQDIEIK